MKAKLHKDIKKLIDDNDDMNNVAFFVQTE